MFGKGRSNFRAMVEDKMAALSSLLSIVSTEINKIENYFEKLSFSDTFFLDDIRETLYHSVAKELYSLAEKGIAELSKSNKAKWKVEWGDKPQGISDIEIYYRRMQDDYNGTLPPLETVWKDFKKFHSIRKYVTHPKKESENIESQLTMVFIKKNMDQIKQMLRLLENVVLNSEK